MGVGICLFSSFNPLAICVLLLNMNRMYIEKPFDHIRIKSFIRWQPTFVQFNLEGLIWKKKAFRLTTNALVDFFGGLGQCQHVQKSPFLLQFITNPIAVIKNMALKHYPRVPQVLKFMCLPIAKWMEFFWWKQRLNCHKTFRGSCSSPLPMTVMNFESLPCMESWNNLTQILSPKEQ